MKKKSLNQENLKRNRDNIEDAIKDEKIFLKIHNMVYNCDYWKIFEDSGAKFICAERRLIKAT